MKKSDDPPYYLMTKRFEKKAYEYVIMYNNKTFLKNKGKPLTRNQARLIVKLLNDTAPASDR